MSRTRALGIKLSAIVSITKRTWSVKYPMSLVCSVYQVGPEDWSIWKGNWSKIIHKGREERTVSPSQSIAIPKVIRTLYTRGSGMDHSSNLTSFLSLSSSSCRCVRRLFCCSAQEPKRTEGESPSKVFSFLVETNFVGGGAVGPPFNSLKMGGIFDEELDMF